MRAQLLRDSASVLDATYEVGLSGPGRLHDLFVTHEAMSPGEWKAGGEGLTHRVTASTPRRSARRWSWRRERGLAGLAFADPGEEQAALADMQRRWPKAQLRRGRGAHRAARAPHLRSARCGAPDQPLRVVMIGTDFEVRVWETLLENPDGQRPTYSDIAGKIGTPKAARAVGAAVGKNPICFVVPCHRVIGKSRRPHRLSLGPDAQARDARLGGRQMAAAA